MSAKLLILPFWGLSRCRFDARVAPPPSAVFPILPPFVLIRVVLWLNPALFDLRSPAQICGKSLFFNLGDLGTHGNSGNFRPTPAPPPMLTQFHPRRPKVTQG
jgi:hypothetical protein